MEGDPLRFTYDGGAEENQPITIVRQRPAGGAAGHELRLRLGDDDQADDTMLSIGAKDDAAAVTSLEVRADGRVRVPVGPLDFDQVHRQEVDLFGSGTGIGTQPGVMYLRSPSGFAWFRGGTHSDVPFDNPSPGRVQMRLSDEGNLEFGNRTRQMIDLWAPSGSHDYGIGVQNSTLYFRTNADVCWFRGGNHSDSRGSPGAGGTLAMKLDSGSDLGVVGDITAGFDGHDAKVITRHVRGKRTSDDGVDDLFLNWNNGADVVVGNPSGTSSDLIVSGSITVEGADVESIIKVRTFDRTTSNNGSSPGSWSVSYAGQFDSVFAAYAMLTGFSVTGDSMSSNPLRSVNAGAIPQTVWVDVQAVSSSSASGQAFTAQSDPLFDGNNETSFTLVVIGRKWT